MSARLVAVLFGPAALASAAGGSGAGLGQTLGGIVLTGLVCLMAYAATRFISGRLGGGPRGAGADAARAGWLAGLGRRPHRPGRLEIVDRLNVGRDRQILILRVGDRHYLAGAGADGIQFGPAVPLEPDSVADERRVTA